MDMEGKSHQKSFATRAREGTEQQAESLGKSCQDQQSTTSPPASIDHLIDKGIRTQHARDTDRIWENIRKGGLWLNEFHRQHSERLREHLMRQPKTSLAEALQQYERIKRGSQRDKPQTLLPSASPASDRSGE